MDFITAAHELFRRHPELLRHNAFVRGLYVGMDEPELREFMEVMGDHDFIGIIETAQTHGGAWVIGGCPLPPDRPTGGIITPYHLSVWQLCVDEPAPALPAAA